ncbi:MAG: L,D-transpeptidase family protein [Propionibacteriaceae bacterium]
MTRTPQRVPGRVAAGFVALAAAALLTLSACGTPVATTTDHANTAPSASTDPLPGVRATPSSVSPPPSNTPTRAPTPTKPTPTKPTPTEPTPTKPAPTEPTPTKPAPTKPSTPTTSAAVLQQGDTGTRVRELQHRLRELDWFTGAITGTYTPSTTTGVQGFQQKRGFEASGAVDTATWTKLVAMTTTPTDDELHNRLVAGPAIMRQGQDSRRIRTLQARLKQLAWFSGDVTDHYGSATVTAVKGFQAKRAIPVTGAVDQRTWDRLVAMTRTPTTDQLNNKTPKPTPVGHLDSRCLTGRAICISKSSNSLVWVVNGTPQFRADVRFGSELTPTREGSFSVGWKSRDHVSTIYHTPMPFAMFFSGGQAVHYSADFAARGYNGASHGCVNVRNRNGIAWLFDQVSVGDKVIVYR